MTSAFNRIEFAVYDLTIFPNDRKQHITAEQNLIRDGQNLMSFSDSSPQKTQKTTILVKILGPWRKMIFQISIKRKKWPVSVQQNLDHMRQNGCQKRIPRVRKHRKQYQLSRGHSKIFFLQTNIGWIFFQMSLLIETDKLAVNIVSDRLRKMLRPL